LLQKSKSVIHRAGPLLAVLALSTGCGGRSGDLAPGPKHFTPEAVNALHPGMTEAEIASTLGQWDRRIPEGSQRLSYLDYGELTNRPGNGFVTLQVILKRGRLAQATLSAFGTDDCVCFDPQNRSSEGRCPVGWASSCLALLVPPAKTCAVADMPPRPFANGNRRIEVLFDPIERQPSNVEQWEYVAESRLRDLEGDALADAWGRVRLAWQPDGWRVHSACIKTDQSDLAMRLPARDMREEVAEALQLTSAPPARASDTSATSEGSATPTSSGGTARPISAEFSAEDLELLRLRLSTTAFQDRLRAYTCGDPPPQISFQLSLVEAAEYQEREVLIRPTPNPSPTGRQRCLSFGLDYELDREIAALDHGPPIDYHYKDPHTGQELTPKTTRDSTPPVCDCSKRDSNGEWVTWPAAAGGGHSS
jgi:hypothetical protein